MNQEQEIYNVNISSIINKWENKEFLTRIEKSIILIMLNEAKNIKCLISSEKDLIIMENKIKELSKDKNKIKKLEEELIKTYLETE